jgi:hypothetical protein
MKSISSIQPTWHDSRWKLAFMNARRLTLGAGLVVGAVLLMPWRTASPLPGPTAVAAPSRTDERVRIEHEVVRIPVTPPKPPGKSVRLAQPVPRLNLQRLRGASQPLRASNATLDPESNLVGKAVKQIVGDGRYRPEPFPRVK